MVHLICVYQHKQIFCITYECFANLLVFSFFYQLETMYQLFVKDIDDDEESVNAWKSNIGPIDRECSDCIMEAWLVVYITLSVFVVA